MSSTLKVLGAPVNLPHDLVNSEGALALGSTLMVTCTFYHAGAGAPHERLNSGVLNLPDDSKGAGSFVLSMYVTCVLGYRSRAKRMRTDCSAQPVQHTLPMPPGKTFYPYITTAGISLS